MVEGSYWLKDFWKFCLRDVEPGQAGLGKDPGMTNGPGTLYIAPFKEFWP